MTQQVAALVGGPADGIEISAAEFRPRLVWPIAPVDMLTRPGLYPPQEAHYELRLDGQFPSRDDQGRYHYEFRSIR